MWVWRVWRDVQEHCHIATASSSCIKDQDAYNKLKGVDSEGSPCSGACLQLLLRRLIPLDQFQMSWKTVQALLCILTCPVVVSSVMAVMEIYRRPTVASAVDHTENTMFRLLWSGWEMFRLCQHCRSGHHKCSWKRHIRLVSGHMEHCWVTWDMFRSSGRILWQVPWLMSPGAAAETSSTVWEQLACTNIATSCIFSSVLSILGRPVCSSSSCKLSLPCANYLCHLNTVLQPKAFRRSLLDHVKHFSSKFVLFLAELDIFLPFTTVTFFLDTRHACTQLRLAGRREEQMLHHLVAPRIHCSA
jgi:hypothetical protein